jgi:hypothetical protein
MTVIVRKELRKLRIIWTSRLDGSLVMVWADEGLETMSADVSYLSALSLLKGRRYAR